MILGIDIGTSYTSACILTPNGTAQAVDIATGESIIGNKYSMPTAVYAEKNGTIVLGQKAVNKRKNNPSLYRAEFKRNLGENVPVVLGDNQYTVCELYTYILRHIISCVGNISSENIDEVILTYPASHEKVKKDVLLDAAKNAGLFNVRLVDEPTAAALCYLNLGFIGEGDTILIYDFGGGTFDVSLVSLNDNNFQLLAPPSGLQHCGGVDIDSIIEEDIVEFIRKNIDVSELGSNPERKKRLQQAIFETAVKAKHSLSTDIIFEDFFEIGNTDIKYSLSRETFNKMIAPMVGDTIKLCHSILNEANVDVNDLSAVLLVGGSSRIPLIKSMVSNMFSKSKVLMAPDLEMVVSQGALFYSENHTTFEEVEDPEGMFLLGRQLELNGDKEAIEWYKKAAEHNHVEAQYYLAECYCNGKGVNVDYAMAVYWYIKASEQGYQDAQYKLGYCYYSGTGIGQDYSKAVDLFFQVSNTNSYAQLYLGICYYYGYGVNKDIRCAEIWLRKAADAGVEDAQYMLSNLNFSDDNNSDSKFIQGKRFFNLGGYYGAAVKLFEEAAADGHKVAQKYLAICYEEGLGVKKDSTKAAYWYRKAAVNGESEAYVKLANCLYYGEGVKQDYSEAAIWYRKAAERDNSFAQNRLGMLYYRGLGVEINNKEAYKWIARAAKQEDPFGQLNMGEFYYSGIYVSVDYDKSIMWFEKATEHNQTKASAQNGIGLCYVAKKNYDRAFNYFTAAAEAGDSNAQYYLGWCYKYGMGTSKNIEEAKKWFVVAANKGNQSARNELSMLS